MYSTGADGLTGIEDADGVSLPEERLAVKLVSRLAKPATYAIDLVVNTLRENLSQDAVARSEGVGVFAPFVFSSFGIFIAPQSQVLYQFALVVKFLLTPKPKLHKGLDATMPIISLANWY
jgi:hypothetical protein